MTEPKTKQTQSRCAIMINFSADDTMPPAGKPKYYEQIFGNCKKNPIYF
jgi:hypothetical protein